MSYTDFQITADFWVTDDANSGIFIRLQDPKTIAANNSYEVNIFDKRPTRPIGPAESWMSPSRWPW